MESENKMKNSLVSYKSKVYFFPAMKQLITDIIELSEVIIPFAGIYYLIYQILLNL